MYRYLFRRINLQAWLVALFLMFFLPVILANNELNAENILSQENGQQFIRNALIVHDAATIERLINEKKLSPNTLLEIVVTQSSPMDNNYHILHLTNQNDLINLALRKGARFSDIKIERCWSLPTTEAVITMLENHLNPDRLIDMLLLAHCEKEFLSLTIDEKLIKHRNELVRLALDKGGNPNYLLDRLVYQWLPLSDNVFIPLFTPRKEDLVKIALEARADPQMATRYSVLPSYEISNLLLNNPQKPLDPDKFVDSILLWMDTSFSHEDIKEQEAKTKLLQRSILVKLALEKGANTTRLATIAITENLPLDDLQLKIISVPKKEELVTMTFEYGINVNATEILVSIVTHYIYTKYNIEKQSVEVDETLLVKLNNLIKFALQKGADPNDSRIFERINGGDLDPSTVRLLFNNEYKKIDSSLFETYFAQTLEDDVQDATTYKGDI